MEGLSGAGALSTSLASNIIQNPMIANQTNEALARQGLKALIPTSNTRPTASQGQGGTYTPTLDDYGIKAQREGVIGEGWGLRSDQIKPAQINPAQINPTQINPMQQRSYAQENAQNINSAMDNMARANGGEAVSQGKGGYIRYVKDANGNIIEAMRQPAKWRRYKAVLPAASTTVSLHPSGKTWVIRGRGTIPATKSGTATTSHAASPVQPITRYSLEWWAKRRYVTG